MHRDPWLRPAQLCACFGTNLRTAQLQFPSRPSCTRKSEASPRPSKIMRSSFCRKCLRHCSYLRERHRLILVTKGAIAEQSGKVERSGLKEYFAAVEIVAEKNPAAYARVVEKYDLARDSTWMVGNSPKSDINPALAAGLHAIFVPARRHLDTRARRDQPSSSRPKAAHRRPLRRTPRALLKSARPCHPERSRSSGGAKDLPLNRPNA